MLAASQCCGLGPLQRQGHRETRMADEKSAEDGGRLFFKSEIFKDGPKAGGNYSSSIGAEQGLEVFGGAQAPARRQRPARTYLEPAREIPVFAETDVLIVGGGPAGTAAGIAAAPPRAHRSVGGGRHPHGR